MRGVLPLPALFRPPVLLRNQVQLHLTAHGGREGRNQAVVIPRRNGIELVVMTPGTADGQPQERGARRGRHVVQGVVADPFHFIGGDLRGKNTCAQEAGGHQRPRIVRSELVAGQLPADELGIGLIGVEGVNNVIAIRPGVWSVVVVFEPAALGETRRVQPVPRPALAIVRTGQQTIDGPGEGFRRRILLQGGQFFRRGRKSGQRKRGAPQQGARRSAGRELQLMSLQLLRNKAVDGRAHFGRLHRRRSHILQRLKGPVRHSGAGNRGSISARRPGSGIRRPEVHPANQVGNNRLGKFALRRHLQLRILIADRLN